MKKSILWIIGLLFIIALGGGVWLFTQDKGDTEIQEKYYENGQLMYRAQIVNGVPNGEYVEYYENGNLKTKGEFIDGKENGKWVGYNEYGSLIEYTWENGNVLSGIAYAPDGSIEMERVFENNSKYQETAYWDGEKTISNYMNEELEGPFITYYTNGNVKYEGNYKAGKQNGEQTEYYRSGEILSKLVMENGNGIKYYYSKTGELLGTIEYKDYEKYDGTDFDLDVDDGYITHIRNYKNGKMDGEHITYREDGSISFKGNYKNGKEDGYEYQYDEEGNVISTALYREGNLVNDN